MNSMNPEVPIEQSAIIQPKKIKGPDWLLMFRKFIRHGTTIASFVPSGASLAREIIRGIDFDKANCIVELGAGTGPITTEIAKHTKSHTRLIAIEQDPDFCIRLREKFPQHEIIQGDAAKVEEILASRGIQHADHVISGLPLPSINYTAREAILDAAHRVLMPGGTFRQLTYMPWVFHAFYRRYFAERSFTLVPWNFPPAGVYVLRGYNKLVRS